MKDKKIFIIKLKEDEGKLDDFRDRLKGSLLEKSGPAFYYIRKSASREEKDIYNKELVRGKEYGCVLLDYSKNKNDGAAGITHLYWAKCKKSPDPKYDAIHCTVLFSTEDRAIIENFVYFLQLDLAVDFPPHCYINYETSELLYNQLKKYEASKYKAYPESETFNPFEAEGPLHPLAQKNEYCLRKYKRDSSQVEQSNHGASEIRSEFQRDYDRILYSKAYRRMVDKAQIFSSVKGDHYRTRLTHTLTVCQIARSISQALNLNCALTEAIAIGHDLGHTPFGHQGERTLNNIITGKKGFEVDNLAICKCEERNAVGDTEKFPYGGFKHNYQGVRVATRLENPYLDFDGLNLSYQTLNGMWMHTKQLEGLDIKEFSAGFLQDEGKVATTLEGQIVFVADEIAQRSHDIDDALTSNLITLEDLEKHLELQKLQSLRGIVNSVVEAIDKKETENRFYSDKQALICTQISSRIVNFFIQDVIDASRKAMDDYDINAFEDAGHKVNKQVICFSRAGETSCKYLEEIINKRVINSREVTVCDSNGSNVILALFRAYYKNPMLLHEGTLNRIWIEFMENDIATIDFKDSKPKLVKKLWEDITTKEISVHPAEREKDGTETLFKQRKILIRNICDFIAGMTDSYAIEECRKITL